MTGEQRRLGYLAHPPSEELPVLPLAVTVRLNHLLNAAASVSADANEAWAQLWGQCKELATGGGMVTPVAQEGFVPPCGWPEFLEHLWLLKHYLDSIQRICEKKH